MFAGTREGDQPLNFPAIYFTNEFLTVLRQKKIYKNPQFTLEHLGRNDVTTFEGIVYKEEEVSESLKDTDLKYYFGNIEITDFVKFICL